MAYTCPLCFATSHNPRDLTERFCGNCNKFADDQGLDPRIRQAKQLAAVVQAADLLIGMAWTDRFGRLHDHPSVKNLEQALKELRNGPAK